MFALFVNIEVHGNFKVKIKFLDSLHLNQSWHACSNPFEKTPKRTQIHLNGIGYNVV